jgi:hypothetical protein
MKYKIGEEVKQDTTACEKDFPCLSDNGYSLCKPSCKVINSVGKVHFVKCNGYCNYKMEYSEDYLFICSCPVRNEIYNLYEI